MKLPLTSWALQNECVSAVQGALTATGPFIFQSPPVWLSLLKLFTVYEFVCIEGVSASQSHSGLFLTSQLTSRPLSQSPSENPDNRFLRTHTQTHTRGHAGAQTHTWFQSSCGHARGKWDVPFSLCAAFSFPSLWGSLCPTIPRRRWSELRANWQRSSLARQQSEYEATLLDEYPTRLSETAIMLTDRNTHTVWDTHQQTNTHIHGCWDYLGVDSCCFYSASVILVPAGGVAMVMCVTSSQEVSCVERDKLTGEGLNVTLEDRSTS